MAELITLARPYARAAYQFANENKIVDNWHEYLAFSAGVVQDESLSAFLHQPEKTYQDRLQSLVDVSNNSYPEDFKNFLSQLSEHNRLSLLPTISDEYGKIRSEDQKELNAEVESAYNLTPAESALLEAGLEKRYGQKVKISVTVNPELIAGVVIRVGDQVIDDSVLAKLKQMKTKLIS